MPYSMPSPSSSPATTATLPPPVDDLTHDYDYARNTAAVAGHRRTRSASATFSDERGPGAFASLGPLPRRTTKSAAAAPVVSAPPPTLPKRAVFHFRADEVDDDDSGSSTSSPPPEALPLPLPVPAPASISLSSPVKPVTNSLGLSLNTRDLSPPVSSIRLAAALGSLASQRASSSSLVPFPRSSPLSSSQPPSPLSPPSPDHLPRTPSTPIILLANGKPLKPSLKSSSSSPNITKELRHLRAQSEPATPSCKNVHFAESGLEDIRLFDKSKKPRAISLLGAESETETENDSSATTAFPFPPMSATVDVELNPATSSPVPHPNPPAYANIHLESVVLPRTRPPAIRGSVLVRNVCFEKHVAVRFTLDNWQTTSEVTCKHVVSLPSLPPPFPRVHHTLGDAAATMGSSASDQWDRFSFVIRLEDFERKLVERTVFLVARYQAHGVGEWWDNNATQNYKLQFQAAPSHASSGNNTPPASPVHAQQRSFNAPSTLRTTPVTGSTNAGLSAMLPRRRSPRVSPVSASPPLPASPPPAAAPAMHAPKPKHPTLLARAPTMARSVSSPESNTITATAGAKPTRSSSPLATHTPVRRTNISSKLTLFNYAAPATPPLTPPHSRESSLTDVTSAATSNAGSPLALTMAPAADYALIGGMPATAPHVDLPWPSSSASPLIFSLASATTTPKASAFPPPTSPSQSSSRSGSPSRSFSAESYFALHGSPPSTLSSALSSGLTSPTDSSSYAAFVKQWCFAQSPSPALAALPAVDRSEGPGPGGADSSRATPAVGERSSWLGMDFSAYGGVHAHHHHAGGTPSPILAGFGDGRVAD